VPDEKRALENAMPYKEELSPANGQLDGCGFRGLNKNHSRNYGDRYA
jgi:hypothetical protein